MVCSNAMSKENKVEVKLEGIAGKLGAEVYSAGDEYVCLLPADTKELVVGHGETVADAVSNWDDKLKAHLRHGGDDELTAYVNSHLIVQPSPEVDSVVTGKVKADIKKSGVQNMSELDAKIIPDKKYKTND